jgi:hypothetical protein
LRLRRQVIGEYIEIMCNLNTSRQIAPQALIAL